MNGALRDSWFRFWITLAVAALLSASPMVSLAAEDTTRFYGTWTAAIPLNGQTLTMVWVQDREGFKNYVLGPGGRTLAGAGRFSAADGNYTTSADAPNNAGTYHFVDKDTVVCTNSAGQTVTWKRDKTSQPRALENSNFENSNSDYRAKPVLLSILDVSRQSLPDMVVTFAEVQGSPGNYWLQYGLYSPSTGTTIGGWAGGPKSGQFATGKWQPNDPLKRAIPINFQVDFSNAVATIRKKGLQGGLGMVRLEWTGAHGTPLLLAWSLRTADSPIMFPLFVDAQTGKVIPWKRAMDPPDGSDAQLKAIWDSFVERNQPPPARFGPDAAQRAMNCVADIQMGLDCPIF